MKKTLFLLILYSANCFAFDHDYSAFGETLSKYVQAGRVDYAALKNDRAGLDSFVKECSAVSFDQYRLYSRDQKMAMMINLFNAAALQLIVNHYPVESIEDAGGFISGPFSKKFIELFEHEVSLGQVQFDILRSEFQDPRIHFATVSAAKSSPALRSTPYVADSLNLQLEEAEQKFMSERKTVNYFDGEILHLSPIFDWFKRDFGGNSGIIAFAKKYFSDINNATDIKYSAFDWSLNK